MKYIIVVLLILFTRQDSKKEDDSFYHAQEVKKFQGQGYNENYCFLVDFSKHSGVNRFHIYDLKNKNIIQSYIVAHGSGSKQKYGKPLIFGNKVGSNMSSLGVSVLDGRDVSGYGIGIKYWLKGLEKSNSNLRKRVVVIHSWKGIPDTQNPIIPTANSQGCFTVSNKALTEIDKFIQKQENKRILLKAYFEK